MTLRMTIEVELDNIAEVILDKNRNYFEATLANSVLCTKEMLAPIGTITKMGDIDYLMHEIKP